jgi:hypothetical protein
MTHPRSRRDEPTQADGIAEHDVDDLEHHELAGTYSIARLRTTT